MIQVVFDEVRMSVLGGAPVLVLREASGPRVLPIWITAASGAGILNALEPDDADHPGTHDLMLETLATQDAVVESLHIVGVTDGVWDAQLFVNGTAVSCRVSDGVALALRSGATMLVEESLLAHAVPSPDETPVDLGVDSDDAVEQFREFLDHVNPDDFTDQP